MKITKEDAKAIGQNVLKNSIKGAAWGVVWGAIFPPLALIPAFRYGFKAAEEDPFLEIKEGSFGFGGETKP